jgi:predicted enzyme related to lactoylglutathione lyase
MGSVERYPDNTFCWIDLGTDDLAGAKAFYGGLLGWEFEEFASGEKGTYAICRLDGKAVAGLYDQAERPGWGSYIKVGDVDRATGQARELGAEVVVEPFDAPGGGRVATVRDPAGATVSLSRPGESFGAEVVNEDGAWTWNELVCADLAAGARFYTELLGWAAADLEGPIRRTSFTLGNLLIGGAHEPVPQEDPTPGWRVTFWVGDADRAAARAAELGGTVLLPPMDIPVGRFTVLADPQGAPLTAAAVPAGAVRGVDGS